ncbi:MAG: hypothetical protein KAR13_05015 [Desulfobulbaceae bacterium]|nr:hypothetical protein [Desulfobulbaceae bacterium]
MNKIVRFFGVVFMVFMFAMGIAYANDAIPITAEQAFDAWANQEDPVTGDNANVVIVDIRTTAEYHWVGTCAQVTLLTRRGNEINPDKGKVNLIQGGKLLKFKVSGRPEVLPVRLVEEITTSSIAINIPFMTWDDENCVKVANEYFAAQMEDLVLAEEIDVVIMMCRSGKRSSDADFDPGPAVVYEIDHPDGKNGRGGFQGTNYSKAYNGFRGFPGRKTTFQEHESVSWSDAGLPVHIGCCPDE